MQQENLAGLAFAAGLVAALNPCGFAMLPAYLALVVGGDSAHARSEAGIGGVATAVSRAVAATIAMTLGFLAVFGTFGLLTVGLASTVQRYMPYATVLIGVALVALGVLLLTGRELSLFLPNELAHNASWAPTRRLGSMFGYGVGYAVASLSCTVGPFLAVTGAGVGGTSTLDRLWIYVAYAGGFALVVGALAVAVALTGSALVERMRRILPYVNRIGGAVLILVGLYVGYYGYYEVRLFTAGGSPADPVIATAGRLQGAIAGWVHRNGAWPWALLLAVLLAATLLWAISRRRRSRADRATAGDEP
ncbi:MAG: cytochrome c biogenesis protein CcdA [Mycobacterium sp.]